jgi:HSP90 family molecular chaperone
MSLQNLTFEFDPSDPLIVKLNEYRKINIEHASMVVRQIFDNCCIEAGLESDAKNMIKRINSMMIKLIDGSNQEGKANLID